MVERHECEAKPTGIYLEKKKKRHKCEAKPTGIYLEEKEKRYECEAKPLCVLLRMMISLSSLAKVTLGKSGGRGSWHRRPKANCTLAGGEGGCKEDLCHPVRRRSRS